MSSEDLLQVSGIVKEFPGVRALDGADLQVHAGRVHALLGENGAGKSTLVRILTGNQQPDQGTITWRSEAHPPFGSPRQALSAGLSAVYQELTVLPEMSVLDNVVLGQEPTRRGVLRRGHARSKAGEALDLVGLGSVDLDRPAGELSLANQQLVEIARALMRETRLLILDEPSAVLSGDKLDALYGVVESVKRRGCAVLYITHRLDEVERLADDVTVLRDGRRVSTGPVAQYDTARIVREMVGRDVDTVFAPLGDHGDEIVLEVDRLVPDGGRADTPPSTFTVRAGEIVSVAGLVGSGRSSLLRAVGGVVGHRGGSVSVAGTPLRPSLRAALRAGVVLVPEERKTEGLVLDLPVRSNTTLATLGSVTRAGWLSNRRERQVYEGEQKRFGIRTSSPDQRTRQLSGGNQQKVVLAKWLLTGPQVLLLDEPTRGIDVGTKSEIYRIVRDLAAQGLAVVIVSSDLPEVVGLAHRVLVCREGGVVGELRGDEIQEESIMKLALGLAAHQTTGEVTA